MEPKDQLSRLAKVPGGISFQQKIQSPLMAKDIKVLQLNVGRRCNLMCKHCHVEAGPHRMELMDRPIFEKCLEILSENPIETIDITGGAPEMNPHLPWFIHEVAKLKRKLMVRSNLSILCESDYRSYLDIYAKNRVELVTSLPDLHSKRTDRQRGTGVFNKVIRIIKELNRMGYGHPGSDLVLNLVSNPVGAYIPGSQQTVTHEYKKRLFDQFNIVFNDLYCLTNCPVGRYLDFLIRSENYEDYMAELINAFNVSAIENVMCRTTLSVAWNGVLYDCDFNQMLSLHVNHGASAHIDIFNFDQLKTRQIIIGNHCYACTAGAGSSCQGVLEDSSS